MSLIGKVGRQIGGLSAPSALSDASRAAGGAITKNSMRPTPGYRSNYRRGGSLEGLIKTKSTVLEMDGVGYSNPQNWKKRYSNTTYSSNGPKYGKIDMAYVPQSSYTKIGY